MTMRRAFLALLLAGAAAAPASAQVIFPLRGGAFYNSPWGGFGTYGGYPFGGGYGYGGYPYGGHGLGYPYGYNYVTPSYMTYTYSSTYQPPHPLAPYGSPLANDPRYHRWADQYGYALNPGEPAPRYRNSLYPAVTGDRSDRPEQRAPAAGTDGRRARIELVVPAEDAQVWLDGVPMTQTGTVRQYVTPPLDAGGDYSFEVRVTYPGADGEARTVRRTVDVRAGQTTRVDLAGK